MRLAVTASRTVTIVVLLVASAASASPGERDKLNACQVLVERAKEARPADKAPEAAPDDAELASCRQIIREWTLRDSRMSVDEHGRPLR
jgi:hypothetical protein